MRRILVQSQTIAAPSTRGSIGEKAAKKYLKRQGLKFLTVNFRTDRGEIDLVMRDKDCLHFEDIDRNFSSSQIRSSASNSAVSLRLPTSQTDMAKHRDRIKPCKVVRQASKGGATCHTWKLAGAFTLTELLITLLVVGVLAALLLPALNRSKGRAKEARCVSNLKQLYTGFLLYHADNNQFPGEISRQGKVWRSATFFGGNAGCDSNAPPADIRPLYSHVSKGEVFRCPADVGIDAPNQWGVLLEPSLFEVWGVSYWYHERSASGGLGYKKMEWVQRPSAYVLVAEPPAVSVGRRVVPPGVAGPMTTVYWHRARRPGTGKEYVDGERGPRVSPFLFVDGHVKFYDCSYMYTGTPPFPGEVEFEQ
ncbi:MAG TPA: YraN family protein [Clostridia bacterium]|nr:YraN family protein [Clostridia bacterium]